MGCIFSKNKKVIKRNISHKPLYFYRPAPIIIYRKYKISLNR